MARKRIDTVGYTVVMKLGVQRPALLSEGCAGRAFFLKKREAQAFARELREHLMPCVVTKAQATLWYEPIPKGSR